MDKLQFWLGMGIFFAAVVSVFLVFGWADYGEAQTSPDIAPLEQCSTHMQRCLKEAVRLYEAELRVKKNIYSTEPITQIALKLYDDSVHGR